jgi:integrase
MQGCRALSDQEVDAILKSIGGRYATRNKAMVVLGLKTGYRISELLSLQVRDVWQHDQVIDRITVTRSHMKGKRRSRTVVLHPLARRALAAWLAELSHRTGTLDPEGYVFKSHKGANRPISRVQAWRILKEAYEANGLTGTLATHSLRKTFAHRVYEASGRDVVCTQRALGHAHIGTTMHYLGIKDEAVDAAILAA